MNGPRDSVLSRPGVLLPLLAVGGFVFATALALGRPSLPSSLRGGEAAQFLLTSSLLADRDLALEASDLERIFAVFPYGGPIEVPVRQAADGILAVDQPLLYPLLAAPWTAVFGANGMLALNALLLLAVAALLVRQLSRLEDPGDRSGSSPAGSALVVALAAVVLSALFPYVFRMHPTLLWAARGALAACGVGSRAWAAGGGVALGLLAWQLPPILALAPALGWRQRARRAVPAWLGGLAAGAVVGLALASAGAQGPFEAEVRETVRIENPEDVAWRGGGQLVAQARDELGTRPPSAVRGLAELLIDRRSGLLPYFPFVLLALAGAALDARRLAPWQWLLLAGLAGHAVWTHLAPLPGVGGVLLSDPAKAAAYPAFFLLLRRPPPRPAILATVALATLLLGSALVMPFGSAAAHSDPHPHTRGLLARLPLDLGHVGDAGIYHQRPVGGDPELDARLWWPAFAAETRGDELWLLGGERVELFLDTARPLEDATAWRLRNLAPLNVARVRFGGESRRLAFPAELPAGGQGAELDLPAGEARQVVRDGETRHVYPLTVTTRVGFAPFWRQGVPPGGRPERYYLGAALTFFGPRPFLERDVFAAEALGCGAPPELEPGEAFRLLVRAANRSAETWNASGSVRVRLGHRWRLEDGRSIPGTRTDFESPVPPGGEAASWLDATAPRQPGEHLLEIDLIYENVAWFAERRGEPLCTLTLQVTP